MKCLPTWYPNGLRTPEPLLAPAPRSIPELHNFPHHQGVTCRRDHILVHKDLTTIIIRRDVPIVGIAIPIRHHPPSPRPLRCEQPAIERLREVGVRRVNLEGLQVESIGLPGEGSDFPARQLREPFV